MKHRQHEGWRCPQCKCALLHPVEYLPVSEYDRVCPQCGVHIKWEEQIVAVATDEPVMLDPTTEALVALRELIALAWEMDEFRAKHRGLLERAMDALEKLDATGREKL